MKFAARLLLCLSTCSALALAQTPDLANASQRGRELMAAGKFEEAIPVYLDLVRQLPGNPGPLLNLGLALHMSGRERQAVSQFRAVLKLQPGNTPAHLFLGSAYLALNQPSKAILPLQSALRAEPQNLDARRMLAQALLGAERFGEASQQFEKLSRPAPDDPAVWNGLGLSYQGLASQNFERLEKMASGSAYWLALIAEARAKADQNKQAFMLYRQALAKMPGLRGLHAALAQIYTKTGHADWAVIEQQRERDLPPLDCALVQSDRAPAAAPASRSASPPPSGAALVHKLECAFWAGNYAQLLVLSRPVKSVEASFWRTRAYNELSRQAFSRLAQLPPSAQVHELMAKIYFTQKNFPASAREWREAMRLAPQNVYYQQQVAIALAASRDYEHAKPLLQNLLKQSPRSPELNYWLGFTLLELSNASGALPYLEQAAQMDPSALPLHRELGRAYLRAGFAEKAIPQLQAALPIDQDGSLYFQLAQAYGKTGQRQLESEMRARFLTIQRSADVKTAEITPP